jgi:hypothetical protein
VLEAPYDGTEVDPWFRSIITKINKYNLNDDDDYQLLLAGKRGSGKSTLAKHALTIYLPENRLHIGLFGLSRNEFANGLFEIQKEPKPRAICYDEANVNRRDSMTKWNKDLLDLYYSNRGLNIFHIWCNPSIDTVDKTFIEDCVKAVIVVKKNPKQFLDESDSTSKKPVFRYYYWYRPEALLKIAEEFGSLKISVLLDRKVRQKYAWYRGWFKEYTGVLKQEYLEKKFNRMSLKTKEFHDKYGDSDSFKRSDIVKELGISDATISNHLSKLVSGEDYVVSATGHYKFSKLGVEHLKEILAKNNENRLRGVKLDG